MKGERLAEAQVDLQIGSKLLSVSTGIVPVRGGRATTNTPSLWNRRLEAVHILVDHI